MPNRNFRPLPEGDRFANCAGVDDEGVGFIEQSVSVGGRSVQKALATVIRKGRNSKSKDLTRRRYGIQ